MAKRAEMGKRTKDSANSMRQMRVRKSWKRTTRVMVQFTMKMHCKLGRGDGRSDSQTGKGERWQRGREGREKGTYDRKRHDCSGPLDCHFELLAVRVNPVEPVRRVRRECIARDGPVKLQPIVRQTVKAKGESSSITHQFEIVPRNVGATG